MSPQQRCFVTANIKGEERTVEIIADSLYEAAAMAIEAFRNKDGSLPFDKVEMGFLKVAVGAKVHTIQIKRVKDWLTRVSGTADELRTRQKIYDRIYEGYIRSLSYEHLREFRKRVRETSHPEHVLSSVLAACRVDENHFPSRQKILELIYAWKACRKSRTHLE